MIADDTLVALADTYGRDTGMTRQESGRRGGRAYAANLPPIRERFDAKWTPEPNTGCWLWTGAINKGNGYGHFGPNRGIIATHRAHRVAWILYRGPVPEGMVIDHMCRVRSCVNPDHLRLATPQQNALENSVSIVAALAKKTHCPQGHPYAGHNLKYSAQGSRVCRECRRAKTEVRRRAKLGRAPLSRHEAARRGGIASAKARKGRRDCAN